jgi:hypothetical protein
VLSVISQGNGQNLPCRSVKAELREELRLRRAVAVRRIEQIMDNLRLFDSWAATHRLPLYDAALHLAETFGIATN